MITADGALDRAALSAPVFGDDEALARLNAIVHPAVRAESARRFAAAFDADPAAVVVYDVPLLVEAHVDDPWDLIVVADARRRCARGGWSIEVSWASSQPTSSRITVIHIRRGDWWLMPWGSCESALSEYAQIPDTALSRRPVDDR